MESPSETAIAPKSKSLLGTFKFSGGVEKRDVACVKMARLGLFEPTFRPVYRLREIETPWGKARVKGRLGQHHASVIEAILRCSEEQGVSASGRVCLLVDGYQLRRLLPSLSQASLLNIIADLRAATIVTEKHGGGWTVAGALLDEAELSQRVVDSKAFPDADGFARHKFGRGKEPGAPRQYLRVALSPRFADFITGCLPTNYRGQWEKILALKSPLSQSIARLMLTHQQGWKSGLKQVLSSKEGVDGAGRDKHRHWGRVIKAIEMDLEDLAGMGVNVDLSSGQIISCATKSRARATKSRGCATKSRAS